MGGRGETWKLGGVAVLWLATGRFLPDILWRGLPRALLDTLSLPSYGMLCQVVTTLVGLGAARFALKQPASALGLARPQGWHLTVTPFLAPALFVVASFVALKIAEPYLMVELATEGAGASRRNAGSFGKAVTQAPLVLTLVWGALLAAVAEELAFRGAVFGAVRQGVVALLGRETRDTADALAVEPPTGATRVDRISGIAAVVVAGVVFGAMHADMKGSVGIVRVASTTCLGLACGSARLVAGSVIVPMVLHFTYNAVSLGLGRGWFRGESEPLVSVVPNPLLALAVGGAALVTAATLARRAFARTR